MTFSVAPSSAPTQQPEKRTPLWAKFLLVALVIALAIGAGVAGVAIGRFLGASEERSVQIVRSVKGEEQVILATAALSDIEPKRSNQKFFGLFDIPFSDREVFIKYDFDTKLGIEGKDVSIRATGDKAYTITIPEFIFLGYDDPKFSVATESNGILSWVTPEVDKLAAIEELVSDDQVAEHIDGHRALLESQAVTFYTRIVTSIEPDAVLTFEFTD